MSFTAYSIVPEDEDDWGEKDHVPSPRAVRREASNRPGYLVSVAFLASLVLNIYAIYRLINVSQPPDRQMGMAGLAYDVPSVVSYQSNYNHPDREIEDAAWADLVHPSVFAIALDDSYVKSQRLLHSMRWPWDENKGVYALTSGHELHCLYTLRHFINNNYDGIDSHLPRGHLMHCVEYLLQNVMCHADDTPLYSGRLHANAYAKDPQTGEGTPRMCRNWNKLVEWSKERSACYVSDYMADDPNVTEIDRYKFCPDGSKPWEKVKLE